MGGSLPYDYWSPEFTQFLSQYKFIICFENAKIGTYSTEKIVNPYLANIIPIYWSSHHVKNVFNPESMLFLEDERNETFADLIRRIIELDNDDAKYLEYVNRPCFTQTQIKYWNKHYSMDVLSNKLSKLQFNMKYYVTHYTPLVERKQNIIRELAYAGITEYEFILSKDRDVLTANELQKFSGITNSEASLFLKHMEVYKTDGLDNKIVVVFEDDAVLCPNFSKRLNACLLQLKNENWDVLFSGECCGLHCDVTPGKIIKATNTSRGTCMYVLNFGVGKRLYEIFNTQSVIRSPIDWWFNFINSEYNLNYFWSEPTLVEQGSDNGLFKSSLR
jgi:glycosyl transferase family 25